MPLRTRRILAFALAFPPLLLLLLPVYAILVSPYSRAVVFLANALLSLLNPPMRISITPSGGWAFSTGSPEAVGFNASIADLTLRSFDLALLPALLFATPKPLRERVISLLQGPPAVFTLHVLSAVVVSHALLGLHFNRQSVFCQTLVLVFATGGQVFGFALYLLLTWQFWFSVARSPGESAAVGAAPPRGGRCPCGSGLKFKHCCGAARRA